MTRLKSTFKYNHQINLIMHLTIKFKMPFEQLTLIRLGFFGYATSGGGGGGGPEISAVILVIYMTA